jgi:ketosteroid isomerase-like protein
MATRKDPASFFHPTGAVAQGARAVQDRYDADAKAFAPGGRSRLEVLQSGSSGQIALWTGLQHAEAILGGRSQAMTLRVTEVFRFEAGWKLVHRHADMADGQRGR